MRESDLFDYESDWLNEESLIEHVENASFEELLTEQLEDFDFITEDSEYLVEEAIQILREMKITKDDLEDPDIVKKILSKRGEYRNTSLLIAILSGLIGTAVAITAAATSTVPLLIVSAAATAISILLQRQSVPLTIVGKNLDKLQGKLDKAIAKAEELIKSDPDNADKYKKTIANCKKTLATLDKVGSKLRNKEFRKKVVEYTRAYNLFLGWMVVPSNTGNNVQYLKNVFEIAEKCKIPASVIMKNLVAAQGKEVDINKLGIDTAVAGLDAEKKYTLITRDKDSEVYLVDKNTGKFYRIDLKTSKAVSGTNPYKILKRSVDVYTDMDALKEADMITGYYMLSDCPECVQKKVLPIK